jgi:hypothetical protein
MWPEALGVAAEMVDGVEAVLMHPFALHAAHHAEALKLPMAVVSLIPIASSREQVPIFFPGAPGWGWLRNGIRSVDASSTLFA